MGTSWAHALIESWGHSKLSVQAVFAVISINKTTVFLLLLL